jgi:hypothetical protein
VIGLSDLDCTTRSLTATEKAVRLVRVVLTVEPANGAQFNEVTNLVIALLKESGSGDETDTFVNPKLVSAHEEFV